MIMDPNDDMERLLGSDIAVRTGPIVKLEGTTADERAAHAREITKPWLEDPTGPYFFDENGRFLVRDANLAATLRAPYVSPSPYGKR